VDDEPNLPLIEGIETERTCPQCAAAPVLLAYRKLGTLLLHCPRCEYTWTVRLPDERAT
jgi:hypothetical protein